MAWRRVLDTLRGTGQDAPAGPAPSNPLQGPPLAAEKQAYYTLGPLGGLLLDCVKAAPPPPKAGADGRVLSPGIAAATANTGR